MVSSFAFLGVLCITSGLAMPHLIKIETNEVVKLNVTQKKVSKCKSNEIKLKDVSLEISSSLSANPYDFLVNPDDIDDSIINMMKLDTSNVNIGQIGNYTYTITYKKKIYNGTVVVKSKPLPQIDNINLKSLSFEVGTKLSTDKSTYITETLAPEVINAINLDISGVDITKPGNYLYSITYNGKLYTNTITIYEPKLGNETVKEDTTKKEETNNTNIVENQTTQTTDIQSNTVQ